MEVKAVTKYTRISAFKARNVTRHIQGMPALGALEMLEFYPQKAARLIYKTLKSALANAENNNALNPANMIVKEAVVGEGRTIKRFMPRARGSASPIMKRTSHIRIILTERTEEVEETPKQKSKKEAIARGKARRQQKKAQE
ncbi:MAG: 50S ribosomal protein L22 [Blastochloris sp.]|nr:50S ribosomal protein L22 [Blastochloris sp.]